jgi:hypothetical protein
MLAATWKNLERPSFIPTPDGRWANLENYLADAYVTICADRRQDRRFLCLAKTNPQVWKHSLPRPTDTTLGSWVMGIEMFQIFQISRLELPDPDKKAPDQNTFSVSVPSSTGATTCYSELWCEPT